MVLPPVRRLLPAMLTPLATGLEAEGQRASPSVRVAGQLRRTRLTTTIHTRPMTGGNEARINTVWRPESAGQPRGSLRPTRERRPQPYAKSAFEISPARQSPNAADMISIARGNELKTKPAHAKSFSPDVSA